MFTDMLGKIVAILTNLPDYMSGGLLDLVEKLAGSDGKVWFDQLGKFLRKETCWTNRNPYLRSIATGVVPATTGQRTFCSTKAMFPGYFDQDFMNFNTDVLGKSTPEAGFEVFEMIQNGSFQNIFEGFGVDTRKLFWSQDQALTWIENNPELLHPQGFATFLPFWVKTGEGTPEEKEEFFVASARRFDGELKALVRRFSNDVVWNAEYRHRFVFPQLVS